MTETIKIYVTKKDPYEFVMRGFESLTIWFGTKPVFDKGYCTDNAFGLMKIDEKDFRYPGWTQHGCYKSDSMKGKCFSKMTGPSSPVWLFIWNSLLDTYAFDKEFDLYEPVDKLYNEVRREYLYKKTGRMRCIEERSDLWRALNFIAVRAADREASMAVEREGSRWWEWCLEVEIQGFALAPKA